MKNCFLLRDMLQVLIERDRKEAIQQPPRTEKEEAAETFASDNNSEFIRIRPCDLLMVRSADNYIDLVYKEEEKVKQKLIRNTLKNIEAQLKKYPGFVRCHRTCIVNKKYILDFARSHAGYKLKLSGFAEEVPVSRQYLLLVKEAVSG